jgi:hypothetical protein
MQIRVTSTSGINLSSATNSTSPIAGAGPNIGHNTPTNVLAWTWEQVKEQYKAIAVASFFTPHFPHHRLLLTRHNQASSAASPPAPSEVYHYPKPDTKTATNCGINAKPKQKIGIALGLGAQRIRRQKWALSGDRRAGRSKGGRKARGRHQADPSTL